MSWVQDKSYWDTVANGIDPAIRLYVKRDNWWWRLLGATDSASAYGPLVFIAPGGDIEHELFHEGRHVQQQRWCALGLSPWLGFVPWAVLNVFVLPVLFTARFWFELDAETRALNMKIAWGSSRVWARQELVGFADRLAGAGYRWAWPRRWARRIASRRAEKIWPYPKARR